MNSWVWICLIAHSQWHWPHYLLFLLDLYTLWNLVFENVLFKPRWLDLTWPVTTIIKSVHPLIKLNVPSDKIIINCAYCKHTSAPQLPQSSAWVLPIMRRLHFNCSWYKHIFHGRNSGISAISPDTDHACTQAIISTFW